MGSLVGFELPVDYTRLGNLLGLPDREEVPETHQSDDSKAVADSSSRDDPALASARDSELIKPTLLIHRKVCEPRYRCLDVRQVFATLKHLM